MEQGKTRNKLILQYKGTSGSKTLTHVKVPTKMLSGKKSVDALKMRSKVIDTPNPLVSFRAKSLDHAKRIFAKQNIKYIASAIYFDNEGNQIPLYPNSENNG
jgi:hypothetical protein